MDMMVKAVAHLNEDDIKDIIAEYATQFTGFGNATKDNVRFEFGVMEDTGEPYLKVCVIEVEAK